MAEKHFVLNTAIRETGMQNDKLIQTGVSADKVKTVNYFDSWYMNMMDNDNNKTISLFEMENKREANSAFNIVAEEELPVLKMHHDSAKTVYSSLTK
jgi:predicted outer membrane protein